MHFALFFFYWCLLNRALLHHNIIMHLSQPLNSFLAHFIYSLLIIKVIGVWLEVGHIFSGGKKAYICHARNELWIKQQRSSWTAEYHHANGRTWNSVHLIFDYDLLLKRMKSFPTGGQAESWSHIITSNTSTVLIPLQMKRRVFGVEGMGKMMEGWMVKKGEKMKSVFWSGFLH